MYTKISRSMTPTTFGRVSPGDPFEYQNEVFVKVGPITNDLGETISACSLEDGSEYTFKDTEEVVLLKCMGFTA